MRLNILQLSDIHLCGNNSPNAESVLLGNDFPKGAPDVILSTGDIFDYTAFSEEASKKGNNNIADNITKAIQFFDELLSGINEYYQTSLSRNDVLFVPGNHEIKRSGSDLNQHLEYYNRFLTLFYSDIPSWYNNNGTFIRQYPEKKVIIVGFRSPNCNNTEVNGEKYDDYGLIEAKQLFEVKRRLKSIPNREEYSIVAALHHQFLLIEERDKSKAETNYLRNNEEFTKFLLDEGFSIVLHGHKHINSNRRLNIQNDLTKPEKIITVLGCGSISERDEQNSFNYITVYPAGYSFELEYTSYSRKNAGYYLDRDTIKLPVINKKRYVFVTESAIKENPDLCDKYTELLSYDTITPKETIFRLLDGTLFSLSEVSAQMQQNPDLLYFVLAAAHYRSVQSGINYETIKDRIKLFISNKQREYFSSPIIEQICNIDSIVRLHQVYQEVNKGLNYSQKKVVVFCAITVLLTDFYSIIKTKSEDFFTHVVSKKIDFTYSGTNLSQELRGNTVEFSIDDERRSLEISVVCNTAAAVKVCSLIIKEYEMILHNFERDFSDLGFRVYYVLPKLQHHGRNTTEIDSRQFTAYIPKLLPLLAGRNIYSEPEAFAREVIQNSIDAINVRKRHDPSFSEKPIIRITINQDPDAKLAFFEIEDNGSGMTKYILERYLTTLGLSYYSGTDFSALGIDYNPISQFGIGFLSCFMIGKHIEVRTRHYTSEIGYFLDIPNYDGCFFIQEDKTRSSVGTTIRIWENPDQKNDSVASFDKEKIVKYISQRIENIDIDIFLNGEKLIESNSLFNRIRKTTSIYSVFHFVGIRKNERGTWVAIDGQCDYEKKSLGVLFYKADHEIYTKDPSRELLNNGIVVPSTGNDTTLSKLDDQHYFSVVANLPPDALNLDVSRDQLKNYCNIDWESIRDVLKNTKRLRCSSQPPIFLLNKIYSQETDHLYHLSFSFNQTSAEINISVNSRFRDCSDSIINFCCYITNGAIRQGSSAKTLEGILPGRSSFSAQVINNLVHLISCIPDKGAFFFSKKSAESKKYDSAVLDVLHIQDPNSFVSKTVAVANEIAKIYQDTRVNLGGFKDSINALINLYKNYYRNIREVMRTSITNMFKDKRYTAMDKTEASSAKEINKIMGNSSTRNTMLMRLFYSYFKRAITGLHANNHVTYVETAAISISAIYFLFELCAITIPLEDLKKGISLKIDRRELEINT